MMMRGTGRQREIPTLGVSAEESTAPMRSYAYIAPTATMPPSTATTPRSTATPSPSQGTLPPPQLIQPSEDIPLVAGQTITLAWDWDDELDLQGGRFIVTVRPGEDTQPLVHEVLPLYQREYVISKSLEPGRYLWTISVSGTQGYGTSAGRLFAIVEPTPVSTGSPVPSVESP